MISSAMLWSQSQPIITASGGHALLRDYTRGYSFTVGSNTLQVSSLGLYDSFNDGFGYVNTVGVWTDTGTLLSTVNFSVGTDAALIGNFRWIPVESFDLLSGQTYRVGWFSFWPEYSLNPQYTTITPSADIALIGSVFSSEYLSFAFPQEYSVGGSGQAFVGGNIMYSIAAVPEPATYAAIFGLVVLGCAVWRRRKKSG